MKNIKSFIIIAFLSLLFLLLTNKANATPMYYTFEGQVEGIYKDTAGVIASLGIHVGSEVTYTFLIDFDVDGSKTRDDGSLVEFVPDSTFYVDYISGSAFTQIEGLPPSGIAENNYGDNPIGSSPGSRIFGNSDNNKIMLCSHGIYSGTYFGAYFSDLDIGDTVLFYNQVIGIGFNVFSDLHGSLVLTNIADAPSSPVPEPATYILFLTSIIGLIGVKKISVNIC